MKTMFAVASALVLTAVVPTLGDLGAVRASHGHQMFLAEASGPSPSGHDTALAEASGPSPSGHDTALAEAESNRPSPGGHDTAQA